MTTMQDERVAVGEDVLVRGTSFGQHVTCVINAHGLRRERYIVAASANYRCEEGAYVENGMNYPERFNNRLHRGVVHAIHDRLGLDGTDEGNARAEQIIQDLIVPDSVLERVYTLTVGTLGSRTSTVETYLAQCTPCDHATNRVIALILMRIGAAQQ